MSKQIYPICPLVPRWEIIYPDKRVEIIENLNEFSRKHNLTASLMIAVSKGLQHHHKGFKCYKIVDNQTLIPHVGSVRRSHQQSNKKGQAGRPKHSRTVVPDPW